MFVRVCLSLAALLLIQCVALSAAAPSAAMFVATTVSDNGNVSVATIAEDGTVVDIQGIFPHPSASVDTVVSGYVPSKRAYYTLVTATPSYTLVTTMIGATGSVTVQQSVAVNPMQNYTLDHFAVDGSSGQLYVTLSPHFASPTVQVAVLTPSTGQLQLISTIAVDAASYVEAQTLTVSDNGAGNVELLFGGTGIFSAPLMLVNLSSSTSQMLNSPSFSHLSVVGGSPSGFLSVILSTTSVNQFYRIARGGGLSTFTVPGLQLPEIAPMVLTLMPFVSPSLDATRVAFGFAGDGTFSACNIPAGCSSVFVKGGVSEISSVFFL